MKNQIYTFIVLVTFYMIGIIIALIHHSLESRQLYMVSFLTSVVMITIAILLASKMDD